MAKQAIDQNGSGRISKLAQSDIVAVAAYLAGADRKHVDMEDIAVKAAELAPGRFSWRKYKDQIDLELIYKHLWDLSKPANGEYITGTKNDGWLLTLAGTSFAERALENFKGIDLSRSRLSKSEENHTKRERQRMLFEPAYRKLLAGSELSKGEVEEFFRLDDYVIGKARERKILQAVNSFHNDPDLGPALLKLAALARSKK